MPEIDWRYWVRRLLPELTPLRITLAYLVLGLSALFVSDVLFVQYFSDPLLTQLQALKGGIEVLLTGGFIFVLTSGQETQLERSRARIKQQREELQVLHRVLRHNLRNNLNLVQGYANRVRESVSSEELDAECRQILDAVDELTKYTTHAANIREITETNGEIQTYDLTELVPELVADHPLVTSDTTVSTELPEQATVEANRMFREALAELLTNALQHNDAETPSVTIAVRPDEEPSHMVEIRIRDNGPGIPESELDVLQAGEEQQLVHLSGVGLWFVMWTVRHSNGDLAFEDNDQGGTTVVIQVPAAPEMLSSSLAPLNGD